MVFSHARTLPSSRLAPFYATEKTGRPSAFQGQLKRVEGASLGLVLGQDNCLAYCAGSVIVVDHRRYFWHHAAPITCIAASAHAPGGSLACSVDRGNIALVWRMRDCTLLKSLRIPSRRATLDVTFLGDVDQFIAVGMPGSICVFHWQTQAVVHSFIVEGLPRHLTRTKGDRFVACGSNRYAEFFVLGSKEARAGVCTYPVEHFHSVAYQEQTGQVITGTEKGRILVWEGRKCVRMIAGAHPDESSVTALFTCEWGLCSADSRGVIKLWSVDVDLLATFCLDAHEPREIRSATWWRDTDEIIYVITKESVLYAVNAFCGQVESKGDVISGDQESNSTSADEVSEPPAALLTYINNPKDLIISTYVKKKGALLRVFRGIRLRV